MRDGTTRLQAHVMEGGTWGSPVNGSIAVYQHEGDMLWEDVEKMLEDAGWVRLEMPQVQDVEQN